jgi:glycosyltransferase involved in cell wall biosynthesis
MTNALVSIIVPVYGTEKYLSDCIESLLKQTYPQIEIILVDDQSPDSCPAICDAYAQKDERVRVIHQKNKGVSGARNTGIDAATGEYFCFVDSDDTLEANAIEILLNDILAYGADMSSATKSLVAEDGSVQAKSADGQIFVYEGDEMIKRSLLYDDRTRSLHAKLFSRRLMEDIRFVEGHNINEDGYFLFECYTKKPNVVQHNVDLYRYYFRPGSASNSRFAEKFFDMLYFCNLKRAYIEENMPEFLEHAYDMEARTNLLFLQVLCRTADKQYNGIQKQCIQTVRKLKKFHRPINSHLKKLEWIVSLGLFPLYKKIIQLRYYK